MTRTAIIPDTQPRVANAASAAADQRFAAASRDLATTGWNRFSDDQPVAPRRTLEPARRDARIRECRHMAGDQSPFTACDAPTHPGSLWCEAHQACARSSAPTTQQHPAMFRIGAVR